MDHATRLKLFDAVMAEHRSFLEAILWRLTGDRGRFVDALQESLLQIWKHVEKLDGPAGRSYLYRIAQSGASQAWLMRAEPSRDLTDHASRLEGPEAQASRNEVAEMLRRAISRLPEQQGRAIMMRYLEQKEYDLVAREMNCSEGTARTHVCRALAALREEQNQFTREVER